MRSNPIKNPKRIGIAADHAGYQLKEELSKLLREDNFEVIDFGDHKLNLDDDYPDFVVPLARAVAGGRVDRGVAICGSGVGVCIAANRVPGVRACLINEDFSARQGVEDDNLNIICLGSIETKKELAWELVSIFLTSHFSGAKRHQRRLAKVAALEK
jgi:ribose 5-phosphate isomerase B